MPAKEKSLAGRLLISHPMQRDHDFCETVVLIHTHSAKDGAMGVILNRPSHRLLGQAQAEFADGDLANLPIHFGGPVGVNRLALGGWKFGPRGPASIRYGISREEAVDLATVGHYKLFAFVGYSGWSPGQLENELRLNAWLVCPFERGTSTLQEREWWKALLVQHRPDLRLVVDSPANPELN